MSPDAYVKKFDEWNKNKKRLDDRKRFIGFKEREVWFCAIGINIGHEQDGKNDLFERPVLVLKRYNHNMFMGIPLSTRIKDDPYYTPYMFGDRMFSAVISQTRLFDSRRLLRKIYMVALEDFNRIRLAFSEQFSGKKSDSATVMEAESSEPEGYSGTILSKKANGVNTRNEKGGQEKEERQ